MIINKGGHMSEKSGKSGKEGKCQEEKYVPHIHTNIIRIHVRRKHVHTTNMSHVSYRAFRNTWTARNVEYTTYILNVFHMYDMHVKYILFAQDTCMLDTIISMYGRPAGDEYGTKIYLEYIFHAYYVCTQIWPSVFNF